MLALVLLHETIDDDNGGGGGLVDDTEDVEASNHTGVLGGGMLGVVEVGENSDDGLGDVSSEVGLDGLLHLSVDHRRDLFGG